MASSAMIRPQAGLSAKRTTATRGAPQRHSVASPLRIARPAGAFAPLQPAGRVDRVIMRATKKEAAKKGAKKGDFGNSDAQQLLGFRQTESTEELPKWKIMVQLSKPGTWVPVIWGVLCGAAASGNFHWFTEPYGRDIFQAIACMTLSGPCLTGFTQTINDWYDREIDAINEPNRPIPSGRVTGQDVAIQAIGLMLLGWAIAFGLDTARGNDFPVLTSIALFGTFISYIYSAPPLKLKANGWQGTYALGASYIALPWWAGMAVFDADTLTPEIVAITLMYSIAGLGIAIVNDFKSIEGDRALGLQSIPVQFGVEGAKYITVGTIDGFQLAVAAWLFFAKEEHTYALVLLGLIIPQIVAQIRFFLPDPVGNDVKYQANAQPFLVFGILTTALAVGHINGAGAFTNFFT